MIMYPKHDLYEHYKKNLQLSIFSSALPDVTKKITLEHMTFAMNICEKWDYCMDIGGGTGHYLVPFTAKFKHAVLVEVAKEVEHEQLVKKHPNLTVVHSFIESYKSTEKMDFILLADLFEHIPDIEAFVAQLANLQDKGGVVYMMTPNAVFCGPATESGLYHTRHTNGHIKQYTTSEIVALMKSVGYELELELYEEAPFRQRAKWLMYALSRRDKQWNNYFIYQLVRPMYLLATLPLFWVLERLVYRSERKHRHDPLVTKTQDLAFKKKI